MVFKFSLLSTPLFCFIFFSEILKGENVSVIPDIEIPREKIHILDTTFKKGVIAIKIYRDTLMPLYWNNTIGYYFQESGNELYSNASNSSEDDSLNRNFYITHLKKGPVRLEIHFEFYHERDTTVYVQDDDTIKLSYFLKPINYPFDTNSAVRDLSKGKVQLIIYDSTQYLLSKQFPYLKEFGFNYVYMVEPYHDTTYMIDRYNEVMYTYLYNHLPKNWQAKLYFKEDSLINREAESYKGDILLENYKLPAYGHLPLKMREAINKKKKEYEQFISDETRKEWSKYHPEFFLKKLDGSKIYYYIFIGEYWAPLHYQVLVPELIQRITNKKEIGLKNTADLIISERIESGDLKWYGHGGVVDDDLFTIAGRANHILKEMTGEDFGTVSMYSTKEDLLKLQKRWTYWFMQNAKKRID
jgi:hypothetical protein